MGTFFVGLQFTSMTWRSRVPQQKGPLLIIILYIYTLSLFFILLLCLYVLQYVSA